MRPGSGMGYKVPSAQSPVELLGEGLWLDTAVRDGTRGTWAGASAGQISSSAGQWSGWEGCSMHTHVSLHPCWNKAPAISADTLPS